MTDQPVHGGQPKDRAANEAELRAAVTATLQGKGAAIPRWAGEQLKNLDTLLAALPAGRRAQWVAMLRELLRARSNALVAALKLHLDTSVTVTLAELRKSSHGLMLSDVQPLTASTEQYIGDQFAYASMLWTQVEEKLAEFQGEVAGYVERAVRVEQTVTLCLTNAGKERDRLAQTLQTAKTLTVEVTVLDLTLYVGPLLDPVHKECVAAEAALQVTPESLAVMVDGELLKAFALSEEQQKQLVGDLSGKAMTLCMQVESRLSARAARLTPSMLSRLAPLTTLPATSRKACLSLVGTYGTAWIHCLCSMESPEDLARLLVRCTHLEVVKALTKKVPAANPENLSIAVQVLNDGALDWDVACGKLNKLGFTTISLPSGVNALSWRGIGQAWAPSAFWSGAMETDLACTKHMVQELGVDPSPAKVASYFADMVQACLVACGQWTQSGRPASFAADPFVVNGATWNIIVRNLFGKPQIFHIDSGYQNSPWRTRTA